ncbi:MAG TPA: hypothetical protein PLP25_09955 [Candidatus Limiplasma sp.]|nr:hypothetical protein [Candidatus Limiplasma sp.]HPS82163.1 hypothetical protein [Candidatus Limiplasma sp.]
MKNTKWIALATAILLSFSLISVSFAEDVAPAEALTNLNQDAEVAQTTEAPEIVPSASAAEVSAQPEETAQAEVDSQEKNTEPSTEIVVDETAQPEQTETSQTEPTPAVSEEPDATQAPEATDTPDATEAPAVTDEPAATETPADVTAAPETEAPAVRSVEIHMDIPQNLKMGDTVTLTATLIGYEGVNVSLQWQYTKDGKTWTDAKGANSLTYAFQVNDETASTAWRLAVTVL